MRRELFARSLFDYTSMSVEDALASSNFLIRAVAILDRRMGKRRLERVSLANDENELVRLFFLGTHSSAVDLVRRRDPPPYARSAQWINWTNLGGIVILLFAFASSAGLAHGPLLGVPYPLPTHKLPVLLI